MMSNHSQTTQNIWSLRGHQKNHQVRRAQATVSNLDLKHGDSVLDVGCGEGFIANHLSGCDFVIGIDRSKVSLSVARQNVTQPNLDFVLADVTALPFNANSFDKVMLLEVLEHLTEEEQERLSDEVDRVVKKSGTILVSAPYKEQITHTTCIHCGRLTPLWGHLHSFNERKISGLFPAAYSLVNHCHLPNVPIISLSAVFQTLPFRFWFILNNLLGKISEGYWIMLRYQKQYEKTLSET